MIFHKEERDAALAYWKGRSFPDMTKDQQDRILARGKELIQFHLKHPNIHHLISFCVFGIIFWLDWYILIRLGAHICSPLWAGIVIGLLHAYVIYTLGVYTLHEGSAHKLIILRRGKISHFLFGLANNLSRVTFAETEYYAKNHLLHHANFTTEKDPEFLNFIFAKRYMSVFKPYALIFNFSDFKSQSGMKYNASRSLSLILTVLYHGVFAFFMLKIYSLLTVLVAIVVIFPNAMFWLDRTRQYMEHGVMPLSVVNGARDLGVGGWGMIFGGGPWGQPCHWTHHLYPGIPWYNQLILHSFIKNKILNPQQKEAFLLSPLSGFPRKLISLIKITNK